MQEHRCSWLLLLRTVMRRSTLITIWLLLIAGAAYLFVFEPGKSGYFPSCVFRAITGFTCPGCGSTRALHEILHGDFVTAFTLNPLLLLAMPFLMFLLVRYSVSVLRGRMPRPFTLPAPYVYAIGFVVLSFWIFRNTPFYPFVS
jgi:hypothetical protein